MSEPCEGHNYTFSLHKACLNHASSMLWKHSCASSWHASSMIKACLKLKACEKSRMQDQNMHKQIMVCSITELIGPNEVHVLPLGVIFFLSSGCHVRPK